MTFTQVESLHLTDNGQRITLANPKLRLIIALKPSSKQPKPNLVLRWCRGARVLRVSAVKRFGLPSYGWTTPFSPSDCGPKAFFPPQSTAISLQVNYQPLLLAVFRRMRRGSPEEALHLRVSLHGRTRMPQKTKSFNIAYRPGCYSSPGKNLQLRHQVSADSATLCCL